MANPSNRALIEGGDKGTRALDLIFVHASPRSGSTYFFNVLRRSESLMCFNEPLSDAFGYWRKEGVAQFKENLKWEANHTFLDRDEFAEIVEVWDAVMPLYPGCLPYRDYLPSGGRLSSELRAYLAAYINYARSRGRRPALCDIHSRGRVGALRDAFGGIHIAQHRDPLSQFGSFFRTLPDAGEWYFLVFPLMEMGISGSHPLYRIVPDPWRVPLLPWPVGDKSRRWATAARYNAMAGALHPDTPEKLFRWHLFSWALGNLAAISYSDFVLDIDRAYDDMPYRRSVTDFVSSTCGLAPNFDDLAKFPRYYEFEAFDMNSVCAQVEATMHVALRDGRLEEAVRALGRQNPTFAIADGVELLIAKMNQSLVAMAASADRVRVSADDWRAIVEKHRMIWFNPVVREVAQRVYPLVSPIVRAARRELALFTTRRRNRQ